MASVIIAYFNIHLDHYESNENFSRLRTQNLKWGFVTAYHVGRCRQGLQFLYTFCQKQTPCAQSYVTTTREVATRSLASASVIGRIAA